MGFFNEIFCKHKWKTHEKKLYEYKQREIVKGTEFWHRPLVQEQEYSDTTEVLMCEKCGKLKNIEY